MAKIKVGDKVEVQSIAYPLDDEFTVVIADIKTKGEFTADYFYPFRDDVVQIFKASEWKITKHFPKDLLTQGR